MMDEKGKALYEIHSRAHTFVTHRSFEIDGCPPLSLGNLR